MRGFKMYKHLFIVILVAVLGLGAYMTANQSSSQKQVMILLGPPGSGKGTQAKLITEELKIPHISTGDLFRYNIKNVTELGKKAQEYMNAGRLVPDALVLEMLFDRVAEDDCKNGYLLDGFPRTIPQAESLDKFLGTSAKQTVVSLTVSDDVIIKRISGRLSCPVCGHIHNIFISPSKVEGICDKCGGELMQRPDDNPEVVQERLKVYLEQTAPLIEYYKAKGSLKTVNGVQDSQSIFKEIRSVTSQ